MVECYIADLAVKVRFFPKVGFLVVLNFLNMGALLSKPIASSFRVWDLTPCKTVDYMDNLNRTPITVYLFANKPVRILPTDTWISDKLRFSFDGWYRQRLSNCYYKGVKISWFRALAIFSSMTVQKSVALHWSSIESGLISSFLSLLSKTSNITLPYTNLNSSVNDVKKNLKTSSSYRWSLYENYPTFIDSREVTNFLYSSLENKKSYTILNKNLQNILTSVEETELNPITGSFSAIKADVNCFVQTEAVTSLDSFIYFGTHGYINAQKASLAIPLLMAYERSNNVTGDYIVKGPHLSRSLISISFVLSQLYSKYFRDSYSNFTIKKPYTFETFQLTEKFSNFNLKNSLSFFRQPPQYEVSPLVQILNEFIKHE